MLTERTDLTEQFSSDDNRFPTAFSVSRLVRVSNIEKSIAAMGADGTGRRSLGPGQ